MARSGAKQVVATNRTLESFEQHLFVIIRDGKKAWILIIGFVCLLLSCCVGKALMDTYSNSYRESVRQQVLLSFVIIAFVFLALFAIAFLFLRHKPKRANIRTSIIIEGVTGVLKNRSNIKKSDVDSDLSNKRYKLAINEEKLQEKLMLIAEAVYLNPWNEEALFLFPLSIGGGNNISLLAAEVIQECGNLWNASLLRYSYQYSNFSTIAKTTLSSENLPTIQKWARFLVEEGKKILGFPQAETEENKKLLLDILDIIGISLERP